MEILLNPGTWVALLTLTFLEIVLGIDNIIFISIVTGKLDKKNRKRATRIGLFLAMFMRIIMLIGISWLISMKATLFSINWGWFDADISGQAIILFFGGLFLIYKSTMEIREKVETPNIEEEHKIKIKASFSKVILQIIMIDIIFSIDSILTAVGMTNGMEGALYIMITAVIISVLVMMIFAIPVSEFVNNNPSIQILGLAFLILIGFMLITEGMHLSNASLMGQEIGAVPKGYLYFAIAFSLGVEFVNMRIRKRKDGK